MSIGIRSSLKPQIGYCTNVHAGTDMATIRATLAEFAAPIAAKLPGDERLGVGLWLPFSAASELWAGDGVEQFGLWLREHRLFPFTINGFPFDNFHLPVVKHRVYRPTWSESKRLEYTILLARILARLLAVSDDPAEATVGSISTLPIGWPGDDDANEIKTAGENFRGLAVELAKLESESGRRIIVAIEPEPGCLLDRCDDVIEFFETQLPDTHQRRYLSVCHDVCHSAVMFEDQAETLQRYSRSGIAIGKVQVSSAIDVPLSELQVAERQTAIEQLRQFAEDRYLHQTGCVGERGKFRLVEDLPQWLSSNESKRDRHIRIHFHVPIFTERFGQLRTTRHDICHCFETLQAAAAPEFTGHWEIETYAWTVMPAELRASGLGADIERELRWFRELLGY